MNKTYINILCVLIMGILLFKIISPFLPLGNNVTDSVMSNELTQTNTPFNVEFSPSKGNEYAPTGSLAFDGKRQLPIISRGLVIFVPDDEIPGWVGPTIDGCNILSILLMAIALYEFIRFVININHSKIFVKDNIRRLNMFGWSLIGVTVSVLISGFTKNYMIGMLDLTFNGRIVTADWGFPWTSLFLGLAGLLLAGVWGRGIMLREDHELTI